MRCDEIPQETAPTKWWILLRTTTRLQSPWKSRELRIKTKENTNPTLEQYTMFQSSRNDGNVDILCEIWCVIFLPWAHILLFLFIGNTHIIRGLKTAWWILLYGEFFQNAFVFLPSRLTAKAPSQQTRQLPIQVNLEYETQAAQFALMWNWPMDRTLINAYLTLKALIFSKVLCLKQKHKRKASFRLKATSVWEHRIYTVSQKNVLCQYSKYGPTNHAAASCLTLQCWIEQLSRRFVRSIIRHN